jgi:hypothetical protein
MYQQGTREQHVGGSVFLAAEPEQKKFKNNNNKDQIKKDQKEHQEQVLSTGEPYWL